jgi:hypothetical protein
VNTEPPRKIYVSCVLDEEKFQHLIQRSEEGTYLRFSIQPITSLLNPSVLAALKSLRCVPLSIFRWSTKLSKTSRPCAKNSSSLLSVFWIKLCSSKARNSLPPGCGVGPRNGDSEMTSPRGRSSGCRVELPGFVFRKRLRLSACEGESGEAEEAEMSSVRFASATYVWETKPTAFRVVLGVRKCRKCALRLPFRPQVVQTEFLVLYSLF